MGYNIGIRLIDDFISKSNLGPCLSFKETLDNISKIGFKMYMGVECNLIAHNLKEYSLLFEENPLNDYVELPDKYNSLWYSNLITGIIAGGLESVNIIISSI